jgi:putative transposase
MAIEKEILDRLLADYKNPEDLTGENGVLRQLTKALMERALEAEMATHLDTKSMSRPPRRTATAATAKARKL